jgi:hypothetical protein
MNRETVERLKRVTWDRYMRARADLQAAQTEHEASTASHEAARAWSAWIVAHNPTCPHCGGQLETQ